MVAKFILTQGEGGEKWTKFRYLVEKSLYSFLGVGWGRISSSEEITVLKKYPSDKIMQKQLSSKRMECLVFSGFFQPYFLPMVVFS